MDYSNSYGMKKVGEVIGLARKLLAEPRLKDVNLDSDDCVKIHRAVLLEKSMLKEVFYEFYNLCYTLDSRFFTATGERIEIGAGTSFFKQCHPEVISTDIKKAPHLDKVIDAQNMNISDNSVRSIYGINCFHHFPAPELFFKELQRVLTLGGGCILIEPYYGLFAKEFFKRVFTSEHFDKKQQSWWDSSNNMSIMMGANQALSYIVFNRDRKEFENKYPNLNIVLLRPLNNYLRYLGSGGLNFRQLLPNVLTPLLKFLEFLLIPLNRILALHYVIVIRKEG